MAATLHKLTAGDGYLYLIRQVAASDSTERGRNTLSEYYSAKGESPGRWVGTGLASLSDTGARDVSDTAVQEIWSVPEGSEVHEEQMAALFGEGLHPNAVDITNYTLSRGAQPAVAIEAAHLGRRFAVRTGETEFQRALAVAYREHNARLGHKWNTPLADDVRAQIRTTLARQRFADEYGRGPHRRPRTVRLHRPQHPRPHHRSRRLRRHVQPSQIRLRTLGSRPAGCGP